MLHFLVFFIDVPNFSKYIFFILTNYFFHFITFMVLSEGNTVYALPGKSKRYWTRDLFDADRGLNPIPCIRW